MEARELAVALRRERCREHHHHEGEFVQANPFLASVVYYLATDIARRVLGRCNRAITG